MKKNLVLLSVFASTLMSGVALSAKASQVISPIKAGNVLISGDKTITFTSVTGSLADATVSGTFSGPIGSAEAYNLLFQDPSGFLGDGSVTYNVQIDPSNNYYFDKATLQSTVFPAGNSIEETISGAPVLTINSIDGSTGGPVAITPLAASKFITVTDKVTVLGTGGGYVSQFTNFFTQVQYTPVPEPMTYAGGALALGLGFLVRRKTR